MVHEGTDLIVNGQSIQGTHISNIEINKNSLNTLVMRLYFVVHTYMNISVDWVGSECEPVVGYKITEKNLATR